MNPSTCLSRCLPVAAIAALSLVALPAAAQAAPGYRNVTTGAALKAGVYGRIAVQPEAPPPPVIYPQPVIASQVFVPEGAQPVYLYVPPGQVRKWKRACARWSACNEPVLFVRMDNSPSRWGKWRVLREQELALHERD